VILPLTLILLGSIEIVCWRLLAACQLSRLFSWSSGESAGLDDVYAWSFHYFLAFNRNSRHPFQFRCSLVVASGHTQVLGASSLKKSSSRPAICPFHRFPALSLFALPRLFASTGHVRDVSLLCPATSGFCF